MVKVAIVPSAVINMPSKSKNKDNGDKVKSSKKNAGQPKVTSKRLAKEFCQVCKKKADKAEDGIVCGVCGYFYHASLWIQMAKKWKKPQNKKTKFWIQGEF